MARFSTQMGLALGLVVLLVSASGAQAFNKAAAVQWALDCWNGCPQCECNKDSVHGDGTGWCEHPPGCGCTPFVSAAYINGGGWSHSTIYNCATFQGFAEQNPNWSKVGTSASSIQPGDLVVMGGAAHCCIGTGQGLVTCHNKNSKNVGPPLPIDGVYRQTSSASDDESMFEDIFGPIQAE